MGVRWAQKFLTWGPDRTKCILSQGWPRTSGYAQLDCHRGTREDDEHRDGPHLLDARVDCVQRRARRRHIGAAAAAGKRGG
jgi:hypothetical protein